MARRAAGQVVRSWEWNTEKGSALDPGRVEMTFRKLFTQDDIHDYFWKARLLPAESQGDN